MSTGVKKSNKQEAFSGIPDPVEVPFHAADGSEEGTRTFTPGTVSNYPNIALLKEAVRHYQGRLRRGTASTLGRSEIHGTTRKPYSQKGTGRARAGTKKSPLWKGGGVTFGPKPRNYDYGLPRNQRRLATHQATLSKLLDGETLIVASIDGDSVSTSTMGAMLSKAKVDVSCLIGLPSSMAIDDRHGIALSWRNLRRVQVLPVKDFNTLALLKNRKLVLTEAAFDEIQKKEETSGWSD